MFCYNMWFILYITPLNKSKNWIYFNNRCPASQEKHMYDYLPAFNFANIFVFRDFTKEIKRLSR